MHEDEPESSTSTLRVGGWLPPVNPVEPAQKLPDRAMQRVAESRSAGGQPAAIRRVTRSAQRRAAALARRRRGALGVAATITALGVAGALVATLPRSESPAALTPLPPAQLPYLGALPPLSGQSDSSAPASPASSATTSTAPGDAGRPSAPKGTPTPDAGTKSPQPAPFQASFEAEAQRNVLGGQAQPLPRDDASDGFVVRFVGNREANFLRFTGLTVPESGTYNVRIHYISGDPRQATILVNGRFLEELTFPVSPDWYTVDAITLRMRLKAGTNTIEMRNDDDYAPDFDRIDLSRS
jgi:hypothetical protein